MAGRLFDLLGDPIPERRGLPGRTGHVPTSDNARKIRLLLVAGWAVEEIAEEIGISAPTLRKHYFRNGKVNLKRARELAIAEVRGRLLLQLDQAAETGNVGAIKAIRDIVEKAAMKELPQAMHPQPRAKAPVAKGKKEIASERAREAPQEWAALLPGIDRAH